MKQLVVGAIVLGTMLAMIVMAWSLRPMQSLPSTPNLSHPG